MTRRDRILALLSSAALAAGALGVVSAPAESAGADARSTAVNRLKADSDAALSYRSDNGFYDFVGVPAGVDLDNPAVSPSTGVVAAADAHLARYGAAFGADQAGTTLTELRADATVTGDVVRYQQNVGGVPVMGGEFVVSLGPDRELDSILAHTSRVAKVPSAQVAESSAADQARRSFQRSAGQGAAPTLSALGRWVVDPSLIGASTDLGIKTAWRFELRRGPDERRMVLVDDQTGQVLMNNSLVNEAINRVVCDNANTPRDFVNSDEFPCTNPATAARVEGGLASAVSDVNDAFVLAGAVSSTYEAIGVDLTALIGRDQTGGGKALAQTVRLCYTGGGGCPYENAFWNGLQMYYGTGFASADDVVGHEMTHGVTERTSGLFYWSQSGAMNESLSDIMGEIVDHQNVTASDTPATAWALAEDVPGLPNGLRNIQDPTLFNDPDRTGSPFYVKEACCGYPDSDGVHTNSGVGNKTFYLASQGGTFNGQTITGIDVGDSTLTKSAKLWLLVDQTLSSGSDYADEAAVLEQSCAVLQGTGVMTAANCAAVHQATLATELRSTPVNNPQPVDATDTCPPNTTKSVLLDSETGAPTTKFTAGPNWSRNGIPGWGQIAHSSPAAWSNSEPNTAGAASLVAANGIALPDGQQSFLFFHHWRLLDYDNAGFYDAGTVEVDGVDVAAQPWVNGPTNLIESGVSNPAQGRMGFGGDSRGYVASRLDLSAFAGQTIVPRFTMNRDGFAALFKIGWYVDDITVYTCTPGVLPPINNITLPSISGTPVFGQVLTASPGTWSEAGTTFAYQWRRGGTDIPGATASTYQAGAADLGLQLSVRVTASKTTFADGIATSAATGAVQPAALSVGAPTIKGKARVGKTLTALPGSWGPTPLTLSYQWLRNGAPITGATGTAYKLKKKDKGKKISVRVTGTKPGFTTASATSPPTKKIKPKN